MNPASLANLRPAEPGNNRNPLGRSNPAKRATGEAAWKSLLADFEINGAEAIMAMREANPTAYVQAALSGIPAEKSIDLNVSSRESLSEEQARHMAEEIIERNKRRLATSSTGADSVHDSAATGLPTGQAA